MATKGENKFLARRLANAYLSSVTSITLVLLLVGIASMLLLNARSISVYFRENLKFSVLMEQEVSEKQAAAFRDKLEKMPEVRTAELITREMGTQELTNLLGEDFMEVFETVPIPLSVDITLTEETVRNGGVDALKAKIEKMPQVDEVIYQKSLVDALNDNLNKISIILSVMILLLFFISYVLISNTVRLSVYSRRFTIRTMKLVGATRAFISRPFLVEALFQGIYAALLAILLLVISLIAVKSGFSALRAMFEPELLAKVMGVMLCGGVLLCVVSTLTVVNKLLSSKVDELYY